MDSIWQRLGITFTEPVRDPLWGTIMLPDAFKAVLSDPEFVKLSRIMQLGPAHLVYPGATHTRRAHSIGVYAMATRVLKAIAPGAGEDLITPAGARAFLVAALCHDVGHFPYAHSLKELPLDDHEALTARAVLGPMAGAVSRAGADPAQVAAIVDLDLAPVGSGTGLYRALLSGVLDPDKLDYLNRDAWACGVPYGVQDTEFILRHIMLDQDGRPGVDERGVMAVEGVLFSKYQMYRAVYWHKSVRAATSMVKKAVMAALHAGSLDSADLYGLDDAGFYALMSRPDRDPDNLIRRVFDGDLLQCCYEAPFDDSRSAHRKAAHLLTRPAMERELAVMLAGSAGQPRVVIDLPEPLSFESSMNVVGSGRTFSQSATVFRPEVVKGFAGTLRVMRVFCDLDPAQAGPRITEVLGTTRADQPGGLDQPGGPD
jgi:HD superfamily phosphohydrolase